MPTWNARASGTSHRPARREKTPAPNPASPAPVLAATLFRGDASTINSVILTFTTTLDPTRAQNATNYVLEAQTTGRRPRTVSIPISSVVYNDATKTVQLILNQPLNLYALVGCVTAAEYAENAAALELSLTAEETSWLETGPPRTTAA